MALPDVDVTDLARFKGKQEEFFGYFAPEALAQATFLIQELSGVEDIDPADARGTRLFKSAVMELAYDLYTEQEYADINVNPFSSETIGSYSYSKSQTATAAIANNGASLLWLSLLKNYLISLDDTGSAIQHGGVSGFENDGVVMDVDGGRRIASPRYDDNLFGGSDVNRNRII